MKTKSVTTTKAAASGAVRKRGTRLKNATTARVTKMTKNKKGDIVLTVVFGSDITLKAGKHTFVFMKTLLKNERK